MDFDTIIDRRGTASYKWERYGPGVLPFWVADMDFASPPAVVRALERRAAHGVYGYALVPTTLIEAIVDHLAGRHGWAIEPDWLVWLPGVVPALNLACRAFAARGETVATIVPAYPPFLAAPDFQGRQLLTVPARVAGGRWQLPLDELEAAVTPDTRVLLFCHPHNPLGRVWSRDEVAAVAAFCRRHDIVLVSDEIHCDLLLDPPGTGPGGGAPGVGHVPPEAAVPGTGHVPSIVAAPEATDLTVTLMAPSKTFNLPGLNFAFAVIPDEGLRRRFVAAGAGVLPFPGCFAIDAAEAAYREGGQWLDELLVYLRGNAALVESFLANELPDVTTTHVEATYLAWLDASGWVASRRGADGGESSASDEVPIGHPEGGDDDSGRGATTDPARACLRAGIALSGGGAFGAAPAFLRLNFACPRSLLEEGLRRLRTALG